MNDVDKVRLKTSDKSNLVRQRFMGDGVRTNFALDNQSVLTTPALRVFVNNTLQTYNTHYTADLINGVVIFVNPPNSGSNIEVDYFFSVYSDEEVQVFLDEAGNDTNLAAARNLLAWAASQARLAMRETLSGGGGAGTVTRDTSVVAREMRETAKALVEIYNTGINSTEYMSEGLTEVIWNDFMLRWAVEQDFIRDGL